MNHSKLNAYFERIGLKHTIKADEQGLSALHQAHLTSIPFENLDIHLGRAISLEPDDIFHKLVINRRGGYCFEMNSLFQAALKALGFQVRSRLARVWLGGVTEPGPRTHQLLLVELAGGTWLADVGFGGEGILEPIPLEIGRVSRQLDADYRLVNTELYGLMLQREEEQGWVNLYSFVDEVCFPADFRMANHFTSTAPESVFTHKRVACLVTESGRKALLDARLAITEKGERQEHIVELGVAYMKMLETHFGLVPNCAFEDFRAPMATG